MIRYDPEVHHRRSIRLRGYDYAQPGAYFVTICTQQRECRFGTIQDGQMVLNEGGQMVARWCQELPRKYPSVLLDEFVVMPNHFHGILILAVGADRCVRPRKEGGHAQEDETRPRVRPRKEGRHAQEGRHVGLPLHRVVQWFKTMTTNEYIREVKEGKWPPFNKRLWQRNYYERVVRNEAELGALRAYIVDNPLKWEQDENHPTSQR